ncbi:MAG: hypothetical protein AAF236_10870 [Verrucomicrobiota bacterium]
MSIDTSIAGMQKMESSERPPIRGTGRVIEVLKPNRLYRIEMPNGCLAYAVVEKKGPFLPENQQALDSRVTCDFSPFNMSRCKISCWN